MHCFNTFRTLIVTTEANSGACRRSNLLAILLVEPLDATRRVDQLLLAGEEGVAGRANFYVKVSGCRTCLERVAADAGNDRFLVVRVNSRLHQTLQMFLLL